MTNSDKKKTEERLPISKQGHTVGKLLMVQKVKSF